MLFIFTTILLILAGISLAILLKKLSNEKLLEADDAPVRVDAASYRPLFAPTDDELRLAEAEERRQLTEKRDAEERQAHQEKLRHVLELHEAWQSSPDRAATIELLRDAAESADGNGYLHICESVLAAWNEGRLSGIEAGDLAQLLETHFWLLPADQRTPGASFRLRSITADLRNGVAG